MIENTKCECGHQNPLGTVLCESCGKPIEDESGTELLDMKYDGVLRKSQKSSPSIVDRIWRFFSSVKIAIYIILITLISASLGTIYPQENTFMNIDPSTYYKETYGTLGYIYYLLGLSHTYESWWFITLLFMIGTSLVICSLDRVLPLYRALSKQQIRKHLSFLNRQKVVYNGPVTQDPDVWTTQMAKQLKKQGYRVHTEDSALLAEKNRFSRWGPYINHIGLIIFLLAVLMRAIPSWHMDQYISVMEGQTVKIPQTSYYLKNEKFTIDYYTEEEMTEKFREKDRIVPKIYETKAVLYRCKANCDDPVKEPELEQVHEHNILVNHPMNYKGLMAYQFDFKDEPTLLAVKPTIKDKTTGATTEPFELSMLNPQEEYKAGNYRLKLKAFFAEFALDEKGAPISKSNSPKAPAFVFQITGPGLAAEGENYIYFPRQVDKTQFRQDDLNGATGKKIEISVGSMENVQFAEYTSFLNIRVDRAIPFIWVGAAISMIGLIMGFYWQHRRIWLRIDEGQLTLGAHTNKNWFGIRKEVARALEKNGIVVDHKSLEKGRDGN